MTERKLRLKGTYRRFLILLFFFGVPSLAVLLGASSLQAQEGGSAIPQELQELPILLSADEVTYDEALGIVTARGDVEINQGGRTLLADTVNYNQRSGVVTASGNVRLIELDGVVYFAEYVELSDDLREGFIRDIGVLLTDRTRIAAASGRRRDGRVTVFRKTVFSPCKLCREDPSKPPLWQLKADQVIHDQEEHTLTYRDAHLELYGVPVAYTPYFSHPDPTVKRETGFLAPTFGSSENLGVTLEVPYYWNIAPDRDATFAPIITTKQSVVLAGEYRELFPNGIFEFRGSGTIADKENTDGNIQNDRVRGHVDSIGRFAINDTWRWGFDLERASDDTYLRLYNFSDKRSLATNLFTEYLRGRDYFAVNGFLYQGLRQESRNEEFPIILPLIDYNFLSEPDSLGGRYSLDANLGILSRIDGRDTRRVSLKGGWELPFIGPIGDVYRLTASVQADGYWVDDFNADSQEVNPPGNSDSDTVGRLFPQVAAQWRYPLASDTFIGHQVVEPVVQVVAAPDWANNGDIPNEDSLGFDFDDTNLMSLNRFAGVDRVDPGSRVDYGLGWAVSNASLGEVSAFLGQSYRLEEDDAFREGSGLEDNLSDVVGRIHLVPQKDLDVYYRFRMDKEDLSAERHDLDLRIGPPVLNLDLTYTFDDTATEEFDAREEVSFRLRSKLNKNWSLRGAHRQDLENDDPLSTTIGLTYKDECFFLTFEAKRTYYEDREISEEDSFMVKLEFKHLGQVSASQ